MNLKEIERVVAKIQTQLFKNSNSYAVGMLKSHFKGAGIQFKEHQVYNPGDDVRFIDWKLSAKTTHTFIKTFEEERNIEITVVLDITQSMFLGYDNVSKLQASLEIACLLFLLAEQTKDTVRVIIFSEEIVTLPTNSGHAGIAQLIAMLEKMDLITGDGRINIQKNIVEAISEQKKLAIIKSYVARGKEVVYLTDFNDISDFETINKLIYRRNMHCFRITSPLDDATTKPYTVYSFSNNTSRFIRTKSLLTKDLLEKGRWKKLSVKTRYLEDFVREML